MPTTNFDKIISRRNTQSVKYDGMKELFGADDLLPLWVADMDFETPEFIRREVLAAHAPQAWGYLKEDPRWRPSIVNWLAKSHDWKIQPEWLSFIPGIVKGIGMAVNILTNPGDEIIIQPPVYHPFRLVPEHLGRKVVENPLIMNDRGELSMDLDGLERLPGTPKLLILSNPHNPAGKVWDRETLRRLAEICHRRNIIVISDEIHSDMVLPNRPKHTPFHTVSQLATDISITFGSPSKAFNMPALATSYAIVSDTELRERFFGGMEALEFNSPSMGQEAAVIAAYTQGDKWLKEMLEYIEANIRFVEEYCQKNIPEIRVIIPDASFLVWLDCRGLKLNHSQLIELFQDRAKLALNDGEMFGRQGAGFMRLNIGAPRAIIEEALKRLATSIRQF